VAHRQVVTFNARLRSFLRQDDNGSELLVRRSLISEEKSAPKAKTSWSQVYRKKEFKLAANASVYEFLPFGKHQFQLTTKE
jgi:hypothetical protein